MTKFAPSNPAVASQAREIHANVLDFGAKFDGSSDDAPGIQAAISSLSGTGGIVVLPARSGRIASEISITTGGITLRGTGSDRGGNATLISPTAPMRSCIRVAFGGTCIEDLFIYDPTGLADYSLLRDGDSLSSYKSVLCWNSKFDGFHAAQIRNWAIGTVTKTSGTGPIPTVTSYSGPLYGLPYTITINHGALVSSGTMTASMTVDSATVGPITIPADGMIQFPHIVGYDQASGIVVTFSPAATYSDGDTYAFTVTGSTNINDICVFEQCWAQGNGSIYCTPAYQGSTYYGYVANNRLANVPASSVLLTVGSQSIKGTGTNFLSTVQARSSDFMRIGTFDGWQGSHAFPLGTCIQLDHRTGRDYGRPGGTYIWQVTDIGSAPHQTSASFPGFNQTGDHPFGSGVGNSSPVGTTVVDGNITWTCACSNIYQVLNAKSNTEITVNLHGQPPATTPSYLTTGFDVMTVAGTTPPTISLSGTPTNVFGTPTAPGMIISITTGGDETHAIFKWSKDGGATYTTGVTAGPAITLGTTGIVVDFHAGTYSTDNVYSFRAGVDYAIGVGSGFYDEVSSNNNTGLYKGNMANGNAACGFAHSCNYGHKVEGGQCSNNGMVGISMGLDGANNFNVVSDRVYMEDNTCADFWLLGVISGEVRNPTCQSENALIVNPENEGTCLFTGNIDATMQFQMASGIGNAFSSLPVTQTSTSEIFTINGGLARASSGAYVPVAGTTIPVGAGNGFSVIRIFPTSDTVMTATPTINPGTDGQEITFINSAAHLVTFTTGSSYGGTALMLADPQITLGPGDIVSLRFIKNIIGYGGLWYQIAPVVHSVCVNSASTPSITLVNGMNADLNPRGRKRLEIVGPTGAFSIAGLYPSNPSLTDIGSGSAEDGLPLCIINFLPYAMTIKHEDAGDEATASNRIWCPSAADLVIFDPAAVYTYVDLVYNTTQSRWLVKDHS